MPKSKEAAVVTQDIAEKVVKHKRPGRSELYSVQSEPGENTKYIKHSMEIGFLPDIDRTDPTQVRERTKQYFNICSKNDMKPTIAGYALSLGCSRVELWYILNGMRKGIPQSCLNTIKKAHTLINSQMEDYMQNGKINPVAGIFLMKNNMGYTDKTEVVVESNAVEEEPVVLIEEAESLPDGE